jgi:hypothetical protein
MDACAENKAALVQGGSLGWCKAMLSRNGIELTPRGGGMLKRMPELCTIPGGFRPNLRGTNSFVIVPA